MWSSAVLRLIHSGGVDACVVVVSTGHTLSQFNTHSVSILLHPCGETSALTLCGPKTTDMIRTVSALALLINIVSRVVHRGEEH